MGQRICCLISVILNVSTLGLWPDLSWSIYPWKECRLCSEWLRCFKILIVMWLIVWFQKSKPLLIFCPPFHQLLREECWNHQPNLLICLFFPSFYQIVLHLFWSFFTRDINSQELCSLDEWPLNHFDMNFLSLTIFFSSKSIVWLSHWRFFLAMHIFFYPFMLPLTYLSLFI